MKMTKRVPGRKQIGKGIIMKQTTPVMMDYDKVFCAQGDCK